MAEKADHPTIKWEKIDENTDRMKVPGGWIIRTTIIYHRGVSVHQIYIKETHGEDWKGTVVK